LEGKKAKQEQKRKHKARGKEGTKKKREEKRKGEG